MNPREEKVNRAEVREMNGKINVTFGSSVCLKYCLMSDWEPAEMVGASQLEHQEV